MTPALGRMRYAPVGLWKEDGRMKFYRQQNPVYVSQSLLSGMYGEEYTEVPVTRLSGLLKAQGIPKERVGCVKLDIEGAELEVLETMLEDSIFPRLLCVEFDARLKGVDVGGRRTDALLQRLEREAGYRVAENRGWNVTLVRDAGGVAP